MSKTDFSKMNPNQIDAVKHMTGPCRVVAGAGSGKTTVLTHRIQYLLERGVPPYKILAITFTKKAASEMAERLAKLVGQPLAKNVFLGSFHSFCLRRVLYEYQRTKPQNTILPRRKDPKKPGFDIILGDKQTELMLRVLSPHTNVLPKPIESDIDYNVALGFCSWQKNYAIFPGDELDFSFFKEPEKLTPTEHDDYIKIYEAFERLKKSEGVIDFDDMLTYSLQILEHDRQFRTKLTNHYQYILVDEFQDTNAAQYQLVKLLSSGYQKNVFIVGDARQAIYSWRASRVEYILNFEKEWPNPRSIELNDNYRSTVEVVDMSTKLIKKSTIAYPGICRSGNGNHGDYVRCFAVDTDKDEAEGVASIIEHFMIREPAERSYSDFAILYRTNAQSMAFAWALMEHDIPMKIASGESFFDRREIQDLLAFGKLANNMKDMTAFDQIISILSQNVNSTVLKDIKERASGKGANLEEIIETYPYNAGSYDEDYLKDDFLTMMHRIHEMDEDPNCTVKDILSELVKVFVYEDVLTARYANKNESKDFVTSLMDTLTGFINNCAKFSTFDELLKYIEFQKERMNDDKEDKVQLMTLHRSKGLEFHTVFLVGMVNGYLPHSQSIAYDKRRDIIPESIEEERRLCYVGITRAQERLFLSRFNTTSGGKDMKPSQFWDELKLDMEDITGKEEFFPKKEAKAE